MDDALLVRRFERLGNLSGDRERLARAESVPARCDRASVGPSTSSSTSACVAARVLEAVNRRDVRMIQRGQHLCLALEPREPIGIERERFGQDLQRDVAIQLRVARAIDLAHPACAERRLNFVGTELCAGRQRHRGLAFNRPI